MDITTLALPLFAFYLLVFCNFIPEIIACRLQTELRNNMIVKHILGFVLLFFLIVLVNPENADQKLKQNFFYAVLVYAWFFITIRNPYDFIIVILILLLVVYVLGARKDRIAKEGRNEEAGKLHKIQVVITTMAFVISLIGFCMYWYDKKIEYKEKFDLETFLFGKKRCKNN